MDPAPLAVVVQFWSVKDTSETQQGYLTGFMCVFRFALSSVDMEQRDYDSRTALHVAAAEGKTLWV